MVRGSLCQRAVRPIRCRASHLFPTLVENRVYDTVEGNDSRPSSPRALRRNFALDDPLGTRRTRAGFLTVGGNPFACGVQRGTHQQGSGAIANGFSMVEVASGHHHRESLRPAAPFRFRDDIERGQRRTPQRARLGVLWVCASGVSVPLRVDLAAYSFARVRRLHDGSHGVHAQRRRHCRHAHRVHSVRVVAVAIPSTRSWADRWRRAECPSSGRGKPAE